MMTPDDRSVMAAELALGLLDGEERGVALREMVRDPAFAAMVERWRTRFAGLYADSAEEAPGDAMEQRIVGNLDPVPDAGAARRGVAPLWRTAAAVAALIAACLVLVVLMRPKPPVPAPVVVAQAPRAPLMAAMAPATKTDGVAFIAVYDRAIGEVRLVGPEPFPADRSAELWAIGADGKPRALGLFDREPMPRLRMTTAGTPVTLGETLAISIEAPGGAPAGGGPQGPVVATGKLVAS